MSTNRVATLNTEDAVAATALLELLKPSSTAAIKNPQIPKLGVLSTPSATQCHIKTGRVHGLLKAHFATQQTSCFEYYLENQVMHDGCHLPLLMACRSDSTLPVSHGACKISPADWMTKQRHFTISCFDKNGKKQVIGEIGVSPFHKSAVAFFITLENELDSCILYKVHGMGQVLGQEGPIPTRQVDYVRLTGRGRKAAKNNNSIHPRTNLFYMQLFIASCPMLQFGSAGSGKEHQEHKNGRNRSGSLLWDTSYMNIFPSNAPTVSKKSGIPTLDFKGRGKVSSNKNAQLVNVTDGLVCVQVAKVDRETYHVDFGIPFTPFHAFAFGIAQIIL